MEAHDIHSRLQHGPWRLGHAGVDRASGQGRRLAGVALAGAHSSRRVKERLGNDDDADAAHGRPGQGRTIMDPSLAHGQHPRQRGHHRRHAGDVLSCRAVLRPAAQHFVLAALRRGRLTQIQELHPGAGDHDAARRLVRRRGHGDDRLRPNGQLAPPWTSATKNRRGAPVGVHCVPTAMPTS